MNQIDQWPSAFKQSLTWIYTNRNNARNIINEHGRVGQAKLAMEMEKEMEEKYDNAIINLQLNNKSDIQNINTNANANANTANTANTNINAIVTSSSSSKAVFVSSYSRSNISSYSNVNYNTNNSNAVSNLTSNLNSNESFSSLIWEECKEREILQDLGQERIKLQRMMMERIQDIEKIDTSVHSYDLLNLAMIEVNNIDVIERSMADVLDGFVTPLLLQSKIYTLAGAGEVLEDIYIIVSNRDGFQKPKPSSSIGGMHIVVKLNGI